MVESVLWKYFFSSNDGKTESYIKYIDVTTTGAFPGDDPEDGSQTIRTTLCTIHEDYSFEVMFFKFFECCYIPK